MSKKECGNCIHYDACKKISDVHGLAFGSSPFCDHYKSKSLFVELPCKVGQTVYIIDDYMDEVSEPYVLDVKVLAIHYDKDGLGVTLKLPLGMRQIGYFKIGKTVFLDRAEAEKKLKEMECEYGK